MDFIKGLRSFFEISKLMKKMGLKTNSNEALIIISIRK
jgi:hypothetical protein